MFSVQTLNRISPSGLEILSRDRYETATEITHPDAILLRSFDLHSSPIPKSVKAIARAGAGVNNIPVEACTERGVVVFNTPGANANSVKELVLAGLLLSSRKIHEGITWVEDQKPDAGLGARVEKEKSSFAGPEIAGKTLGVIGLGAIGVIVANAACDLGMDVWGYDPFISVDAAWGLSSRVRKSDNLEQLLGVCDYVTLHVPLNDQTRGIIDGKRLGGIKNGVRILNLARGPLVDTVALKEALIAGTVSGYVTDFPEKTLHGVPGVLSIPHLGASTPEAEDNCAVMAARQLRDFLEEGRIVNSVNFPTCSLEPSGNVRLLVANKNVPNMLSQILAVLAEADHNVEDMVNRHRDGFAYNIIDLAAECISEETLNAVGGIEGVVMTRMICRET